MHVNMKSRPTILVLTAAVLTLLLLLLLFKPWETRERENRRVSLRDKEEVDRIVLVDAYNSAELIRREGSWYLFGTEPVSPVTVENLLIAASRLEVSSIVEGANAKKLREQEGDSRELSFFSGDRILLSYGLKTVSGRYLLDQADSERTYFVSLPGYPDLDLGRVFSATPDHYRDHLLMDLRPSDIATIEIELASGEYFRFTQDLEGEIRCMPVDAYTIIPAGEANELSMKLLFSYFTSIRYEQYAGISADSLLGTGSGSSKMAGIRVETLAGEEQSLQVFPYCEKEGSKPDLFRALVLYNEKPEAMIVNYIYLDVLMRGLSHYFGEK